MFVWTDTHQDTLRADWGRRTAAEIAETLGATKNSVIGKARRLGLRQLKETPVTIRIQRREGRSTSWEKRGDFRCCQWIYGEPEDRVFCHEPVDKNSNFAFCPLHLRKVFKK